MDFGGGLYQTGAEDEQKDLESSLSSRIFYLNDLSSLSPNFLRA